MANMDGDMEMAGNAVEEVLSEIAKNSQIGEGRDGSRKKTSEKGGVEEIVWSLPMGRDGAQERLAIMEKELTKMKGEIRERREENGTQERLAMMEKELMKMKGEISDRGSEDEATKWEVEDVSSRVVQLSDWARTQLRSAGAFIGRARRETFDCRLKFKREVECDVRDY